MRSILVVVDMQIDFVTGSLASTQAQSIVEGIQARVANFPGEVVFTMDTHMENYLSTQEGRRLPLPHCIRESDGWQLIPELKALSKNRRIFEKPSFGSLALAEYLREYAPEEILFVGVCTDICVISNALLAKAYVPEARIAVEAALCAGVSPEDHHRALAAMAACQIDIL